MTRAVMAIFLLVSVQLGITKQVKRMTKLWKRELQRSNVPYFHSKDYRNYTGGVFRDVKKRRREYLLETLGQLARLRLEIGFTTIIDENFYKANTDAVFRSRYATAYPFAVSMLALTVQLYLKHMGLGYDVNVLIEEGHKNAGQALDIFKTLKETPKGPNINPLNVLTYGLGSKKDHPILQSADMLAFSEWQKSSNGDMEIYNQFHVSGSRYTTEFFPSEKLIETTKSGAGAYEAQKKQWGQRKTKAEPT